MKSCQIYFPIALLLYTAFSFVTIVNQVDGFFAKALPGIKCIEKYEGNKLACDDGNCNFDDPNNVFKLGCDTDCKAQHGANYGYCLNSNVCNCGPPVYSTGKYSYQCLNISMAALFQDVCDEDCRCTHNKIGGGCNFFTKACECGPTNLKPQLDCPYKHSNEYFKVLLSRYAGLGYDVKRMLSTS